MSLSKIDFKIQYSMLMETFWRLVNMHKTIIIIYEKNRFMLIFVSKLDRNRLLNYLKNILLNFKSSSLYSKLFCLRISHYTFHSVFSFFCYKRDKRYKTNWDMEGDLCSFGRIILQKENGIVVTAFVIYLLSSGKRIFHSVKPSPKLNVC